MTQQEYLQQFETFQQQSVADGRFAVVQPSHPILDDDRPSHDEKDFSFDYWAHCSWAARKVARFNPKKHVDCGSYSYFAGIVSAFVEELFFLDIRGLPGIFPNLISMRDSLTNLRFPDNSADSLSCLHVLEHIGLGRYGDKLDAQGDLKAAAELTRILAPGGQLLMVLPMNEKPCVRFNGERFYSALQVHQMFAGLTLLDHAWIHSGNIIPGMVAPDDYDYTGCMVFTK